MVQNGNQNGVKSDHTLEEEALNIASEAIADALKEEGAPNRITLSNGIVLAVKTIPRAVISHIADKHPEPVVPRVYIEDDERYEDNPNDPAYVEAWNRRADVLQKAYHNVCLGLGTSVISVPDGMYPPESDGWVKRLHYFGVDIEVPAEPPEARYTYWLNHYAMETEADKAKAVGLPLFMALISQEEVVRAMRTFRGREDGDVDPGLSAKQGGSDGDNVSNSNPRPRTRNRRA